MTNLTHGSIYKRCGIVKIVSMSVEIKTIRIRLKLQRATFYGQTFSKYSNSKQKIYITGKILDPIISNNQIVLKEGRRVQVLYYYDNLSVALEAIAKFDGNLSFLIDYNSETFLGNSTIDSDGNELIKIETSSICEP